MNVHKKRYDGLWAYFHDGGVACPVQLQRHAPPLLWEGGRQLCTGWFWCDKFWGQKQIIRFRLWDLLAWPWQKDPWLLPCTCIYTIICCRRWQRCGESDVLGPCKDIGWRQRNRGVWFVWCTRSYDFWFWGWPSLPVGEDEGVSWEGVDSQLSRTPYLPP